MYTVFRIVSYFDQRSSCAIINRNRRDGMRLAMSPLHGASVDITRFTRAINSVTLLKFDCVLEYVYVSSACILLQCCVSWSSWKKLYDHAFKRRALISQPCRSHSQCRVLFDVAEKRRVVLSGKHRLGCIAVGNCRPTLCVIKVRVSK